MQKHILYISFDGMLEPLGRSQVLSYILPLRERGFRFSLISLEKPEDLTQPHRVRALQEQLEQDGIRWIHLPYQSGSRGILENITKATTQAVTLALKDRFDLVHARSYLSTGVALTLKRLLHIPYIFDFRGYWVDERIDEQRWFTTPQRIRVARWCEKHLYQQAAAAVSLAEPAAQDIEQGKFGPWSKPLEVIPTCVLEEDFTIQDEPAHGVVPTQILQLLKDAPLVVGYIGSINASYHVTESLEIFSHIVAEQPGAKLLCITRQIDALKERARQAGIPEDAMVFASVPHEQMAQWLSLVDWGLLLINTRDTKRGSMPTKLGEFFATGIRPIQYGCNEEVARRVTDSGSGLVLSGLDTEQLQEAAKHILETPLVGKKTQDPVLQTARERALQHFGVRAGVEKYQMLYNEILRD